MGEWTIKVTFSVYDIQLMLQVWSDDKAADVTFRVVHK